MSTVKHDTSYWQWYIVFMLKGRTQKQKDGNPRPNIEISNPEKLAKGQR